MWYKICHNLAEGQWFSPGIPVSSTNKTDCHDIVESGAKYHNRFHQYQQNEQSPLILAELTEH
jgi:hypothetical protein